MGEQGKRIAAVLALKEGWESYLGEHLTFQFEAIVDETQSKGPIQYGDRLKVIGVSMEDDKYGVIVDVRLARHKYAFPLYHLKVLDQQSPNYQLVQDYHMWFAGV